MSLYVEITDGIAAADALYDLFKRGFMVGVLAVFYPLADQIAQDPTEVIMPGKYILIPPVFS